MWFFSDVEGCKKRECVKVAGTLRRAVRPAKNTARMKRGPVGLAHEFDWCWHFANPRGPTIHHQLLLATAGSGLRTTSKLQALFLSLRRSIQGGRHAERACDFGTVTLTLPVAISALLSPGTRYHSGHVCRQSDLASPQPQVICLARIDVSLYSLMTCNVPPALLSRLARRLQFRRATERPI